ncbi:MAG: peptide chain release factor 2 [Oscillospiraceae bacterium]|nr:peptide chain release factor 2 [Oscillospiraceae bacterium]
MLELEERGLALRNMKPGLEELAGALGIEKMKLEIAELEQKAAQPGFWDDTENSQQVLKRTGTLKSALAEYETLSGLWEDAVTMVEMANEEEDASMLPEIDEMLERLERGMETQRLSTLLSGEYDSKDAILTFHAGAGGTEAQDWVEMLYRMYSHWAESHGYTVKMLDYLDGDEAGLKSASVQIEGRNAYGFLKSEDGIHRLVRVSPFDASGRRQTSFASLEVMPVMEELDTTIDIRPEDLQVDVYRASGAGGQKVNKTSSAVRITHLPTGIVVACQVERSQYQNKDMAMRMLKAKLLQIKEREHLDKIEDIRGDQKAIGWGSQIRSYVFMPYTMVKDHRTSFETGNVSAVMDGDLDGFINAYLKALARGELSQ